jgi:hypothetical protein
MTNLGTYENPEKVSETYLFEVKKSPSEACGVIEKIGCSIEKSMIDNRATLYLGFSPEGFIESESFKICVSHGNDLNLLIECLSKARAFLLQG